MSPPVRSSPRVAPLQPPRSPAAAAPPAPPPPARRPSSTFTPAPSLGSPVEAGARRSAVVGGELVDRYQASVGRGGEAPADLRTYLRGQPIRPSWPARAGGSGGDVNATRCNVFAYNVAYQAGVSVPTREIPLHTPVRRGHDTFDRIHDVLSPAELAAPFASARAADRQGVRERFQQVAPSEARTGDWVLYQRRGGGWSHVDVVAGPPAATANAVDVPTVGSGAMPPRELYRSTAHIAADGSTPASAHFARAMVLRPTQLRPAGDASPNATEVR